ncbi:hypothetical protein BCR44DRAFT_88077 [Catenaria anguillulae PL171]|uniref:Uncharacterized protein n=1 Tax=Catenaria anguillulae PL171 TaxID=765915 RepID=A0A1Y2HLF0_9FUNG|nr:hypothetical protein BCR44DRAFT_88077 [Catenaria anguillulae PL171]
MAPSPFHPSLSSSPSSSSSLSTSTSSSSIDHSHTPPMVLLHSQQQQPSKQRSSASTTTSTTALATAARRPSPTDALKHLRPAIPSPNTLLASLLANPDAHQLDFLSLFDPPATLPSDVLNSVSTNNIRKDSPAMDDYFGSAGAGYPGYPPPTAAAYAHRRFGLPSVSPTGSGAGTRAPLTAAAGYASYPYASSHSAYASSLGQFPPSSSAHNAHQASTSAAALRLQQQQQTYADAFRTRNPAYNNGYTGHPLMQYSQQVPRSGINGYIQGEDADDTDDVYGIMSASHLAHARSTAASAAASTRQLAPPTSGAAPGVVNPSVLDTHALPPAGAGASAAASSSSSTALTLHHDSTPNLAVRLQYAPDGRSLLRADHTHHACQDPMVLGGRLVDMSVHMEHYLQDLLPRKGEDHSDWQPVDITFDILSSRLRQTLEQMERFRGDMTRKASVERKKVAERERTKATKRLQASRAVKPVSAAAGSASGNGKAAGRAAVTEPVRS